MTSALPLGAIDQQTGEYVFPRFASKSGHYVCPECHARLFLRMGDVRTHHFAHYPTENTCHYYSSPTESQIHKSAKMLLKQLIEMNHPIRIARVCGRCDDIATNDIRKMQATSKVHLEYRFEYNGLKVADVAYTDGDDIVYIFEMCHTHKTSNDGRPEPWFELDATTFLQSANAHSDVPLTIGCIRTGDGAKWLCKTCLDLCTCEGRGWCLNQVGYGDYRRDPEMVCHFNCQPIRCSRCKGQAPQYIFDTNRVSDAICKSCDIELFSRTYLNVPYASKDHAKSLGCRYDPRYKKWYCSDGPAAIFSTYEPCGLTELAGMFKSSTAFTNAQIRKHAQIAEKSN